MLISIVIPVYNRAEMVKATLDSVKRQTFRPIQLVLVDNNSSDTSYSVLSAFKKDNESDDFTIDVIKESRPGASSARNSGTKMAKGDWLMFFDSDDTMDDCLLSKYAEKISEGNVDVVTCDIDFTKEGVTKHAYFAKKDFLVNHVFHACLSTQRYIIRKSLFDKTGGWNESLTYWDDWELGIRILLNEPRVKVIDDGVYVHVNVHDDSITGRLYSDRKNEANKAINTAIETVMSSHYCKKIRIKRLLQSRKFVLAGLYKQEKHEYIANEYFRVSLSNIKKDRILRTLSFLIYKYVGFGGRGIDRLIRFFI